VALEEFRQTFLDYVAWLDSVNADVPGYMSIEPLFLAMTDDEFQCVYEVFPDPAEFMEAVSMMMPAPSVEAASMGISPETAAAVTSAVPTTYFPPPYPTGSSYEVFTATLEGLDLLSDSADPDTDLNNERCSADGEAEIQIALAAEKLAAITAQAFCDVIVVAAGFGTNAVACGVAAGLQMAVAATEIAESQCALQDALVDSAEIEATYENTTMMLGHLEDIQYKLDHIVELRQVHLEVVEVTEGREFLVAASVGGQPVEVALISALAANHNTISFEDITAHTTVSVVSPGIHLVQIDLPQGLRNANLFTFQVMYDDVEDLYGFTLFDRRHSNNN
jgi:hypothetical protein